MLKSKLFVMTLLLSVAVMGSAHAEGDVWSKAQSSKYSTKAGGMIGRGFINVLTSPADLVMQTVDKTMEGPPVIGTLTGIGSGAGCTIVRASSGIIDVLTFWVPDFNGFTVSQNYSNCLDSSKVSQASTHGHSQGEWRAPQGEHSYSSQPQTFAVSDPAPTYAAQPEPYVAPTSNNLQYVKGAKQSPAPSAYVKQSTSQTMSQEQKMKYVK